MSKRLNKFLSKMFHPFNPIGYAAVYFFSCAVVLVLSLLNGYKGEELLHTFNGGSNGMAFAIFIFITVEYFALKKKAS